ncbi:MAG: glycosyltransferase family 9 protein [Alphaproteobacteria bacterium]
MPDDQTRILVIKLSALGDFVQAMGPMAAIRKHHPNAHITLLTTQMFKKFGEKCGYFDDVLIDKRPKFPNISGWLSLRKTLTHGRFDRVYDLQNNDRTELYLKLFPKKKKPEWVGAAQGASHRNTSPERTAGHAFEGHQQTLGLVGIENVEIDKLQWVNEDLSTFPLHPPYVLFVPGSAPQHPQKRWPYQSYGELAKQLTAKGYQIVLLGTDAEKQVTQNIKSICPDALDLTGQTSLFQIAALAHKARAAVGNDTGPMHMIGPTACPCLALFSDHSQPKKHAPKGENVITLQQDNIADIEISTVKEKLAIIMEK